MSIETLLEAAKFLELQAQQQQKAREENELREKLRLEQLAELRPSKAHYTSPIHVNHVGTPGEPRTVPLQALLPPSSVPVTVIPIPVVTTNHSGLTPVTLSPPPPSQLTPPRRDPHSPQQQSATPLPLSPQPKTDHVSPVLVANHKLQPQNHPHPPHIVAQPGNAKLQPSPQHLLQCYPGSIVSTPQQHPLFPQTGLPPPQVPLQHSPISRGSPPDDGRHLDNKKRPGGAGTREVHNKLEKNRRAHLKECFEMLKKNIPNVDEKKTSNLSVLRSALRYIQTLKRKEKEYEHEMERLAREKIAMQQRMAELKNDLSQWMDVMEIDRVLRQTVQPEEDQVSTSTASEGEDVMDDDLEGDRVSGTPAATLPTVPSAAQPDLRNTVSPTLTPAPSTHSPVTQHISVHQRSPLPQPMTLPQLLSKPTAPPAPSAATSSVPATPIHTLLSNQTQLVSTPTLQPTVIAHASATHASVIQAVNHVIQTGGPKHIAHLAPSTTTSSVHLAPGHQPIGHITVHPVAHLGQHLPTLYPQPVAVTQSAMVGHIAHTFTHAHVNGISSGQPPTTIMSKQTAVGAQVVTHHPQLVGQTVLNPVTMVTVPPFPVSTLKLA